MLRGGRELAQSMLRVSRPLQEGAVNLAFDLLDPGFLMDAVGRSADGLRTVVGGSAPAAATELRNKTDVYLLVRDVARRLGIRGEPLRPLRELLDSAYALGAFPALWTVEGLGHEYADSFWRQGWQPAQILCNRRAGELPAASLLMLHAGIGLSFAQQELKGVDPSTPEGRVRHLVGRILELCRNNSRTGYLGAAIESLGLVTRTFHPQLLRAVDEVLRESVGDEKVVGLFWHGVGRAIYFLPVNFLPCSNGALFTMARREAPDELARLNAVAGLAWALLLVNQRQPEVLAELVVAPYGRELAADDAFADGVASAIVMRIETTPGSELLDPLEHYRAEASIASLWSRLIMEPLRSAVDVYRPALARSGLLDEVFRYQDLAALVSRLGGEDT